MSDLVGNPEDRFSHNEAHMVLLFLQIQKCDDVLLVLRCNKEYMLKLSNAFMKEKRIVANYGGSYVGMSDDVRPFTRKTSE